MIGMALADSAFPLKVQIAFGSKKSNSLWLKSVLDCADTALARHFVDHLSKHVDVPEIIAASIGMHQISKAHHALSFRKSNGRHRKALGAKIPTIDIMCTVTYNCTMLQMESSARPGAHIRRHVVNQARRKLIGRRSGNCGIVASRGCTAGRCRLRRWSARRSRLIRINVFDRGGLSDRLQPTPQRLPLAG